MAWCHVPGTDCPSAQAAEALILGLMLAEPDYHTRPSSNGRTGQQRSSSPPSERCYFAPAPSGPDLRSFDAGPFRGAFDAVLAGYPCQPFSAAGKRGGADDPRHLWPDVARCHRRMPPEWVFLENVAGHVTLGLETVLRELWGLGYTPAAGLFSAAEVGAPHERLRIFILAHTDELAPRHQQLQPGREQRLHRESGSAGIGHRESPAEPLADTGCPELEGVERGQHHPHRRQVPHGPAALSGGAGLHPPGPTDLAGWAAVLAARPISRPLWAFDDCLAWRVVSRRIPEGKVAAAAESALRRWLMGWPIGHALCACSATEFTLWQQHMLGALSSCPWPRAVDLAGRPMRPSARRRWISLKDCSHEFPRTDRRTGGTKVKRRWACRRLWNGRFGWTCAAGSCPCLKTSQRKASALAGIRPPPACHAGLQGRRRPAQDRRLHPRGRRSHRGYRGGDPRTVSAAKRMAIRIAELARAGLTPDWMPGAVPRCVPTISEARTSMARMRARSSWAPSASACAARAPVPHGKPSTSWPARSPSPQPAPIEAARRGYDDWCNGAGLGARGLIAGGISTRGRGDGGDAEGAGRGKYRPEMVPMRRGCAHSQHRQQHSFGCKTIENSLG